MKHNSKGLPGKLPGFLCILIGYSIFFFPLQAQARGNDFLLAVERGGKLLCFFW